MTLLSELFATTGGAGGGGGMILGDRIVYTSSTTLTVADHEALAPEGYELFGWQVKPIGGGAGGLGTYAPPCGGYGGSAPDPIVVPKALLSGASSVAITVGAGGLGSNGVSNTNAGGQSSFGTLVFAAGGPSTSANTSGVVQFATVGETPWFLPSAGSTTNAVERTPYVEGSPGYGTVSNSQRGGSCPSGKRGGGGGAGNVVGGAVYPHPNASGANLGPQNTSISPIRTSGTGFAAYMRGLGNPVTTVGAEGHIGIGDFPGGGGNGSTLGMGGNGGFPGGGGGASESANGGNGAGGCVIVYPIFRKAL